MKLEVPYYSQIHDVLDPHWQGRSCTVVNLKIVLDYLSLIRANGGIKKVMPSIEELIQEGVVMGGFDEKVGWTHEAIVRLARNYGQQAYRQEFRSNNKEVEEQLVKEGVEKIAQTIELGSPVMVSVLPGFGDNKENHTITLIGVERGSDNNPKAFWCHDPYRNGKEAGKGIEVPVETFKKFWRKLAIFVY